MADDADDAERPVQPAETVTTHARTDRRLADRSVETTPESLYLWQIAVLDARIDALQSRVRRERQQRQHVIDRYETVLADRNADRELRTDGGTSASTDSETPDRRGVRGVLDRVRSLLE
jgi:hypothetical protein